MIEPIYTQYSQFLSMYSLSRISNIAQVIIKLQKNHATQANLWSVSNR